MLHIGQGNASIKVLSKEGQHEGGTIIVPFGSSNKGMFASSLPSPLLRFLGRGRPVVTRKKGVTVAALDGGRGNRIERLDIVGFLFSAMIFFQG